MSLRLVFVIVFHTANFSGGFHVDIISLLKSRHEEEYGKTQDVNECILTPSEPKTVDELLHFRAWRMIDPILNAEPDSKWLTVGDGLMGAECRYLLNKGARAHASDIAGERLEMAHKKGYIEEWSVQNAEQLSFEDDSFDFILCKETYHHCPRPPMAFYEFLRVARKGVMFIEPSDSGGALFDMLRNLVKNRLRGKKNHDYEPVGNYLYRISLPEIKKMMMALNLPVFAYRYMNTLYVSRFEDGRLHWLSYKYLITKAGIIVQDLLCKTRLMSWGVIGLVVFKNEISVDMRSKLIEGGFRVIDLPKNPYLTT